MPRSVMQPEHARVPQGDVPRSSFDLSEGHLTTFDSGYLIPFYWNYTYPGDIFRVRAQAFMRCSSPLDFPLMDNARVTIHWWSAPIRILWDNFRKFFGEQVDPGDSIDYTVPTFTSSYTVVAGDFYSYTGLPIGKANVLQGTSALVGRAYNRTYNYHYRDQNLIDSVVENTGDGPDVAGDYSILRRGKRHDYFTSCLPSPQKGDAVELPLGTTAPVQGSSAVSAGSKVLVQHGSVSGDVWELDVGASAQLEYDSTLTTGSNLEVDLSSATSATINQLRESVMIQQFLERDMRGGTRFGEQIYSHYGVEFQDVRFEPEYLGGGSAPIIFSPIVNQSGSSGNLGDLSAIGTGSLGGAGFTKAFTEPCVILGLICVDADLRYQQGIDRKFLYSTRYDFYWPEFSHLGEQVVENREIWYSNVPATDTEAFGYQERYAELRTGKSRISGEFLSDHSTPLDSWHLAEDFATLPTLNQTFIESNPPMDRVMQVTSAHHWIAEIYTSVNALRPLPLYGVPGVGRL